MVQLRGYSPDPYRCFISVTSRVVATNSDNTKERYLGLRAQTALGDSLSVELDGVIGEVEPIPDRTVTNRQERRGDSNTKLSKLVSDDQPHSIQQHINAS